jgi:hypothetical protein
MGRTDPPALGTRSGFFGIFGLMGRITRLTHYSRTQVAAKCLKKWYLVPLTFARM